jgi:hypothetical protein
MMGKKRKLCGNYPLPVVKPHENIDLLDRQKSREAAR